MVKGRTKYAESTTRAVAMRISKNRRTFIAQLAELLSTIAPATTLGSGFSVQKVAFDHGDKLLWKGKGNKRKMISHYLEGLFRKYPNKPKKVVLEIVKGGLLWKAKKGESVERAHLDLIAEKLGALGVDATRELREFDLPVPSRVATPPHDLVSIIKRIPLHDALQDDCLAMFEKGHLNEAVRKALERFEKQIQETIGEHDIGKGLMAKAFNKDSPRIPINDGTQANDASEREGFMLLTMGAMMGMRNLYSHGDVATIKPMDAFERLCFVSLLFKRIDAAISKPATASA